MELQTTGRHLLVEYRGCDREVLDDLALIERAMVRAAEAAGAHVVGQIFHPFSPQGVSGVVVVEESHLSIHTWPEKGYAAVDFYTCGDCFPERAHAVLVDTLRPQRTEQMFVKRGLEGSATAMRVEQHETTDETTGARVSHDDAASEAEKGADSADAEPFRRPPVSIRANRERDRVSVAN